MKKIASMGALPEHQRISAFNDIGILASDESGSGKDVNDHSSRKFVRLQPIRHMTSQPKPIFKLAKKDRAERVSSCLSRS